MFYPVALRVTGERCTGARKLLPGRFYFFCKGVGISDEGDRLGYAPRLEDEVYNATFRDGDMPSMTFSAVVGENGAGKSTLVELLLRMVNNLGAAVLGEYSARASLAHLHFVDGLDCELYFLEGDGASEVAFSVLRIYGRQVRLFRFRKVSGEPGVEGDYALDEKPIFDSERSGDDLQTYGKPFEKLTGNSADMPGMSRINGVLSRFFYTYLSNYGIYAFNPNDFAGEANSTEYERRCRRTGSQPLKFSQCHWLEGVFHRRESYQAPVVVYPSRNLGNIAINEEKKLAYSRFLSVLVSDRSNFTRLNDHIEVRGFEICGSRETYNQVYLRKNTDYHWIEAGYKSLRKEIVRLWGKIANCNLESMAQQRREGERALNYLVYKTLKVSELPRFDRFFHRTHSKSRTKYDKVMLGQLVLQIAKEASHVSRKIRQTLVYLKFGLYDFEGKGEFFPIEEVRRGCREIYDRLYKPGQDKSLLTLRAAGMEDLTPPPFLDCDLVLEDVYSGKRVEFVTLSSGEKQFVYSITGILYHLINLDSVEGESYNDLVNYRNVLLILEEIELYFHPEMQRKLIRGIIESVRQIELRHVRNIHTMVVTHSPFVLSDIPARNILALGKDGSPGGVSATEEIVSFGANIHDILRHPFFLRDGAQGEFSLMFINDLSGDIRRLEKYAAEGNEGFVRLRASVTERIGLIDEPVLRRILIREVESIGETRESRRLRIESRIAELQKELGNL